MSRGRCGCGGDCLCTLAGLGCIVVTGDGTSLSPYSVRLVLDPDPANALVCTEDGLAVIGASVVVDDSDCIAVTGSGTAEDPLVISPRIDDSLVNALVCGPNGLAAELTGKAFMLPVPTDVDYGASPGDLVLADTTNNDVDVTLPLASSCAGCIVVVKKVVAANTLNVVRSGADLIDGATSVALAAQWASATFASDGTNWFQIGSV